MGTADLKKRYRSDNRGGWFKKGRDDLKRGVIRPLMELCSCQGWNLIYKVTFYITSTIRNQYIFGTIYIKKLSKKQLLQLCKKPFKKSLTQKPHILPMSLMTDNLHIDWPDFWMDEFSQGLSWQGAPGALSALIG